MLTTLFGQFGQKNCSRVNRHVRCVGRANLDNSLNTEVGLEAEKREEFVPEIRECLVEVEEYPPA